MQEVVRFTHKRRPINRIDILTMLKKGMSYSEISKEIERTRACISIIKKQLVENGLITDDEITQAKEARKARENREFDVKVLEKYKSGKSRSQIASELKKDFNAVEDSLQRLLETGKITSKDKNPRRSNKENKIIAALNAKKSASQISRELGIPLTTLKGWIKIMIEEGKIDSSLVEETKRFAKKKCEERRNRILNLLNTGKYSNTQIAKIEKVSTSFVSAIKRQQEGFKDKSTKPSITDDVRQKVNVLLLTGKYTQMQIAELTGVSQSSVNRIKKILCRHGSN